MQVVSHPNIFWQKCYFDGISLLYCPQALSLPPSNVVSTVCLVAYLQSVESRDLACCQHGWEPQPASGFQSNQAREVHPHRCSMCYFPQYRTQLIDIHCSLWILGICDSFRFTKARVELICSSSQVGDIIQRRQSTPQGDVAINLMNLIIRAGPNE